MKKRQNNSARASALQLTLSAALLSISAILFASSFRAAPASQDGFYPALPQAPAAFCGTFTNATSIPIPDSGASSLYPSTIAVSGVGGSITSVTVELNGITHTFPDDIDILLVGPGGQNAIIMSDVGGSTAVTGVTVTLDDAAGSSLPDAGPLVAGTFKPTNITAGDTFPAPAPAPSGNVPLAIFNGTAASGVWSLYVFDDAGGDLGSISGGWKLNISTDNCAGSTPTPTPSPTASPTPTPSPTPIACNAGTILVNFDSVVAPALPSGWSASNAINPDSIFWVTSTAGVPAPPFVSSPNAAFVNDPNVVSDKRLDSVPYAIANAGVQLSFQNNYNLEASPPSFYDAGVLEISIGGGAFADIITAGGAFVAGPYNAPAISTGFSSPLGGRPAWSSTSAGFITSTVALPPAATGQTVVFRWRMGSDSSVGVEGWRIDDVSLSCSGGATPPPTPTPTPTGTPTPTPTPSPTPVVTPTPFCGSPNVIFSQNFDSVVAPALPAGWTAANAAGGAPLWVTSTSGTPAPAFDTAPNAAFIDDPAGVTDKRLDSPSIAVPLGSFAQVTFGNNFGLESTFDGGVLELSINGGAFTDVIAAGGFFVTGGYNGTISTSFSSPIAGRSAWTGNSAGFKASTVTLPGSVTGQNIVLRWRMGSDTIVSSSGWRIDGVLVTTCPGTPPPTPVPTPTPSPTPSPTPTPTPVGCQVLYDQSTVDSLNGTSSQDFETANDGFDDQTADDFVVPGGQTWTVQQIFAPGAYFNGTGPMPGMNVFFYNDALGLPGTLVGSFLNVAPAIDSAGTVTVTIPGGGQVLPAGTYWLSLQARMDFTPGGQWAWEDRTTTVANSPAAWQNPGGGFAAGCLTWGQRGATCGIDAPNPDQTFLLRGCLGAGTPTPTPTANITGVVTYCDNPALPTSNGVLMTLTGTSGGSTSTAGAGAYSFVGLAASGSYTVTPTKTARTAGSAGINTLDVVAIQKHFLGTALLTGCRLTAANVSPPAAINTLDVIATQHFFLGQTFGVGTTGTYTFNPVRMTYAPLTSNQVANFNEMIMGDVAGPFVTPPRPGGPGPDAADQGSVSSVALPNVAAQAATNFVTAVTTSAINASDKLIAFQGDFTFDERVVSFDASQPVQPAGLTANNWNVSGNVLDGPGPIRTLRISAYSNNMIPLSGTGTLFELRMSKVTNAGQGAQLTWAASPNNFIFIDNDLNTQRPGSAAPGSVGQNPSQR